VGCVVAGGAGGLRADRARDPRTRAQRAPPSAAPRRLRDRPHRPHHARPLSRRRQGRRPGRGAEPSVSGSPLGARPLRPRAGPRRDDPPRQAHPRRQHPPRQQAAAPDPLRPHPRHNPRPHAGRPLLSAAVQTAAQSGPRSPHTPPHHAAASRHPHPSPTRVPTRSDLEDLVLDLIDQAGFEPPQVNQPLANGYIPDFRWPSRRLILEADGQAWHDDPISRHNDAQRQAELEHQGERMLRVTYEQVTSHPQQTIERLHHALRESPGSGPAPTASPARGSPPTPAA